MEVISLINILKKKKIIIFLICLLGSIILFVLLLPKFEKKERARPSHLRSKGPYFLPVQITEFTSSNIPCLIIEIEGKQQTLKIDLGFRGCINLNEEFVRDLVNKRFVQSTVSFGVRGKTYKNDMYELPEVKIGQLTVFRPRVEVKNYEFEKDIVLDQKNEKNLSANLGRIGWELFYNFNVLLDCKQSTLAFCDGLETLKKQGYAIESFIETSLLLDRNFVEFEAITDIGPLRCLLDTGATGNLLNKDIEGGSNEHMILDLHRTKEYMNMNPENKDLMVLNPNDIYETSCFKIGEKDFGAVKFQKIKSPLGIDAIVGMEFLEDKIIFIDFPERKIYFYKTVIPLHHSE